MHLSIVIPSHLRADLLRRCLSAVAAHRPTGSQVIVVDDASPNGRVSTAATEFPFARVIRLPKQSGFCVAANTGIRAATGGVVELLNDDTEVTPGWAEAALAHFADPNVVAVAPLVLQLDPTRPPHLPPLIDSAGDEYDSGGFARKRLNGSPLPQGRGGPSGLGRVRHGRVLPPIGTRCGRVVPRTLRRVLRGRRPVAPPAEARQHLVRASVGSVASRLGQLRAATE